ncbi:MAG: polyprenyl synthetase family protein [Bacteroidota bacterium]|nr:polyprenyl synthetase family protein [Bacteroidota bacterium]MDP4191600.1 polyprenyl synthetase family protein [Bacteroidota bacterium]MDP4196844.1 polyprenyl synthetase family protein [Bacteroidota bacterium]
MIKSQLNDISYLIKNDLEAFNDLFRKSLKSQVFLVDLITKYLLKQKGKKIRPLLVILSAKLSGEVNERTYRGAILVELLHSATLVHDDVVDNADKRRGFPSINAIWKNKVAVLMGDYLLARGLMIAVDGKDFDFLGIVTDAVKRMSEGELLQINKTRKLDIDESTYFKIISDKTASLLSTCCEIGAVSSSQNPEYHKALKKFGEYLGIAFQIRDDILDYIGTSSVIGKPLGGDIKEKKITLPLLFSLKNAGQDESQKVLKMIKNGSKDGDVKKIIDFVKRNKGIDYSVETSIKYSALAKEQLSIFPESESRAALMALVDFITERRN